MLKKFIEVKFSYQKCLFLMPKKYITEIQTTQIIAIEYRCDDR